MTTREADRRLHFLEGAVRGRYPAPAPPPSELERWAATLTDDALFRVERLCRTVADAPEYDGQPMGELGRALVEVACLDTDYGDADSVRRAYLAGQPHDPTNPEMAELRAQVERWIVGGDHVFMHGADVRGWLAWHGIAVDQLGAGELVRLVGLLEVFEDHPIEAATVQTDALWAVIGSDGHRKRQGMA